MARFSVSTIGGKDDEDELFETATAEHDAAPVAAGLRFATDDDGDSGVHFDATVSCDAHTTSEVSDDATDEAAVNTDPPIDSTSASPSGARRCFAPTFALLAIGVAAGLAAVGTFAAMDVSPCEISVVASEHSQFTAQTAANRFFPEEHGAFAWGDF